MAVEYLTPISDEYRRLVEDKTEIDRIPLQVPNAPMPWPHPWLRKPRKSSGSGDKMSKTSVLLVALAGLSVAACGAASETEEHAGMEHGVHHAEAGDTAALQPLVDDGVMPVIDVRAAWMRPHPGGRDVTAAYFTIRLSEGSVDRLLSARIDGAERVELHGTMSADGLMQMRPIGPQDVNNEGPLVFTPGGRVDGVRSRDGRGSGKRPARWCLSARVRSLSPLRFAICHRECQAGTIYAASDGPGFSLVELVFEMMFFRVIGLRPARPEHAHQPAPISVTGIRNRP